MITRDAEAVLSFRGRKVVGVLTGGIPLGPASATTIVFDDGSGLSFSGPCCVVSSELVSIAREQIRSNLKRAIEELERQTEAAT